MAFMGCVDFGASGMIPAFAPAQDTLNGTTSHQFTIRPPATATTLVYRIFRLCGGAVVGPCGRDQQARLLVTTITAHMCKDCPTVFRIDAPGNGSKPSPPSRALMGKRYGSAGIEPGRDRKGGG